MELFDLIAWIETKNNPEGIRFEPATYLRLTTGVMTPMHTVICQKIMDIHQCSLHTAQIIFCSSFGAIQLMGFNLYGTCHYDRSIVHFMTNVDDQQNVFNSFLRAIKLDHYSITDLQSNNSARLDFSMKYNGSIAYREPMMDALRHFGFDPS